MPFHFTPDADEVPAREDYKPIPAGTYTARIDRVEISNRIFGDGGHQLGVVLMLRIEGPRYANRVVFAHHFVKSKSEIAQRHGRRLVGELTRALGVAARFGQIDLEQDGPASDELAEMMLDARVSVDIYITTPKDPRYRPENRVAAYKPAPATAPATASFEAPQEPAHEEPHQEAALADVEF